VAARTEEQQSLTDRRRELVVKLKFQEGLSYSEIKTYLSKMDPPMHVSTVTIMRDVKHIRAHWQKVLRPEKYNGRAEVQIALLRYEHIYEKAMSYIMPDSKPQEVAALLNAASRAVESHMALQQDVGFVDRKLGELVFDPEKAARERIPTGAEIRAIFAAARLDTIEAELVSRGEKRLLYGSTEAPPEHDEHDNEDEMEPE